MCLETSMKSKETQSLSFEAKLYLDPARTLILALHEHLKFIVQTDETSEN